MTIRVKDTVARLEGDCGVADAEPLWAALRGGGVAAVDVSDCRSLHAAVAQALTRVPVAILGEPSDAFLRDVIAPALKRRQARMGARADRVSRSPA